MRLYGWSIGTMELPAGNVRSSVSLRRAGDAAGDAAGDGDGEDDDDAALFALTGTVNGAVARLISPPCACKVLSNSAWLPARVSSPGNTYADGPSFLGFSIDRLLFR